MTKCTCGYMDCLAHGFDARSKPEIAAIIGVQQTEWIKLNEERDAALARLESAEAQLADKDKVLMHWHDEAHHYEEQATKLEAQLKLVTRLAENRDKLLVCYRTGKSPSMKVLEQLTTDREALSKLTKGE